MLLKESEIEALTGCYTIRRQTRWLKAARIPFKQRIDESIVIFRQAVPQEVKAPRQDLSIPASPRYPVYTGPGIYFLFLRGELQYIGQARNVLSRIGGHKDKEFDSYSYIECPIESLREVEIEYIRAHRPPLNKNGYGVCVFD